MANQGHPPQRSPGAPAQMPRAPAWSPETMLSEAGNTSWQFCRVLFCFTFGIVSFTVHLLASPRGSPPDLLFVSSPPD